MFERLNHVGVATPSVARAREHYARLFGPSAVGASFDLPAQGVRVCFVDAPNTQIELIEPLGDASPIAKFVERNADGGIHHICYDVPDIIAARDKLISEGARVLGDGGRGDGEEMGSAAAGHAPGRPETARQPP